MSRVLRVVLVAGLVPGVVAASPQLGSPTPVRLTAPDSARLESFGTYSKGIVPKLDAQEIAASGGHYRLETMAPVETILDHYVPQLAVLGWRATLRQVGSGLGLVRFSAGTPDDPATGILTVLPFATTGQAVVNVRLVRSRVPWVSASRPGGGGANQSSGTPPATALFFTFVPWVTLPASVNRAEGRDGGGQPDSRFVGVRLASLMPVRDLWTAVHQQLPGSGWATETQLGDTVQSAVRRNRPDGALSEVWIATALPGVMEIDVAVQLFCSSSRPCADWSR